MKISSVPYLNARPMVDYLERHPAPGIELGYAVPSRLIAQLLAGEVDIVMASTFALLAHPELHLLPGMGITTTGAAWSVRLLSKVPVPEIRTLALDAASRSTNALARILLADHYGITPACLTLSPNRDAMLAQADAAVLIGDVALTTSAEDLIAIDLGQAWYELTGLPFYFAGWVARDPHCLAEAAPLLQAALDDGLTRLDVLAQSEAVRLQLPYDICYRYLSAVMCYRTGPAEEAGLAEYRRRAHRLGLIAHG